MRESKTQTRDWRALGTVVLVAVVLVLGVLWIRHKANEVSPPASMGAAIPLALPELSKITRLHQLGTISLDTVAINGKSTVVAALKTRHTFHIKRADTVQFAGWAFDPGASAPAGGVVVRVGSRDRAASYGLARPDVAAAFKMPNLGLVGFKGDVSVRDLRSGVNPVSIVVISHDLQSYYANPSVVVLDVH